LDDVPLLELLPVEPVLDPLELLAAVALALLAAVVLAAVDPAHAGSLGFLVQSTPDVDLLPHALNPTSTARNTRRFMPSPSVRKQPSFRPPRLWDPMDAS